MPEQEAKEGQMDGYKLELRNIRSFAKHNVAISVVLGGVFGSTLGGVLSSVLGDVIGYALSGVLSFALGVLLGEKKHIQRDENVQGNHEIAATFGILEALGADDIQLGDMEEEYLDILNESGIKAARKQYRKRLLIEIIPLLHKRISRWIQEATKRA